MIKFLSTSVLLLVLLFSMPTIAKEAAKPDLHELEAKRDELKTVINNVLDNPSFQVAYKRFKDKPSENTYNRLSNVLEKQYKLYSKEIKNLSLMLTNHHRQPVWSSGFILSTGKNQNSYFSYTQGKINFLSTLQSSVALTKKSSLSFSNDKDGKINAIYLSKKIGSSLIAGIDDQKSGGCSPNCDWNIRCCCCTGNGKNEYGCHCYNMDNKKQCYNEFCDPLR